MTLPYIFPECYADTALMNALGYSEAQHIFGNGEVANMMKYEKHRSAKVIGVVDEDPKKTKPNYFKEFIEIEKSNSLFLKKHRDNTYHYLIIIRPAHEAWILALAKEVGLPPEEYGLPIDKKELGRLVKSTIQPPAYLDFLQALVEKNPPEFDRIHNWIKSI